MTNKNLTQAGLLLLGAAYSDPEYAVTTDRTAPKYLSAKTEKKSQTEKNQIKKGKRHGKA